MTPADLDQIRALLPPRAPSWVPWARGVAAAVVVVGAVLGMVTALFMTRADATIQHQAIKDHATVVEQIAVGERRNNAEATRTNAAAISGITKTIDTMQHDIRAIGRAVGARGVSQRDADAE